MVIGWIMGLAGSVAAPTGSVRSPIDCRAELLAPSGPQTAPREKVAPLNLARLRDFGRPDQSLFGEAPFSVSPDGRSAALVLRRGDPARDDYCIGVAIVRLDGRSAVQLIDVGGEFIIDASDVRGVPDLPIGSAQSVTPRWSSDGQWLAYLRRDAGRTRVWRARVDGSQAGPVAALESDARDVRWAPDGETLRVSVRPLDKTAGRSFDDEERSGFLYDERFWTLSRSQPKRPVVAAPVEVGVNPANGHVFDTGAKGLKDAPGRPAGALLFAAAPSGARAWTSAQDPALLLGPSRLRAEIAGKSHDCPVSACGSDIGAVWWGAGETLYFMRNASAANGGTLTLLRWQPERDRAPAVVLRTTDALLGCQAAGQAIVCAHERADRPRTLAKIDPVQGSITDLFDPNPEFRRLRIGQVVRLRWTASDGISAYGDLVLPPEHRAGERHPLIVVQYHSRGFLRGGTGDEFPIHALAARGFAVLSIERPPYVGAGRARSNAELIKLSATGFAERKRVLRSIETGVAKTIAMGIADTGRIGITGLSDGAATVQYALVNSTLFSVAALSGCCDEPGSSMFAAGPAYAQMLIDAGFPEPGQDDRGFWKNYSLAANADRIRAPILFQLPDDEFRLGLETYETLRRHAVPVEMYVFAGEFHQKWRPAHRLASYERAIDWFDFWMNGRIDPAPGKATQYERWRHLAVRRR